jgi:hypothetical protein
MKIFRCRSLVVWLENFIFPAMLNGVNADQSALSVISELQIRRVVWLLCLLAAVHVFVFSAAFPFFNNQDEVPNFDLVVKYAHGHFPRGLEPMGEESSRYIMTFNSPEYMNPAGRFTDGQYPMPFWRQPGQPAESLSVAFAKAAESWRAVKGLPFWQNYESTQQPLYYLVAGLWWRVGQWCGITGLHLLYWVRFLNVVFVTTLVWVGYVAARLVFPARPFFQLGVPALLAFMPQEAFYAIQNDVLSPLCFGLAFVCLVLWLRTEEPGRGLGAMTGLALAACFLVKISNLPLLMVSAVVVIFKTWQIWRAGKLRRAGRALGWLVLWAGLPIGAWLAWSQYAFGDFTGSAIKLQAITWTVKPFHEWWHHPIFSVNGFGTFLSGLLVSFWQGEFMWHAHPLDSPLVNAFYVVPTLFLLALGIVSLWRANLWNTLQRRALVLSLGCFAAGVAFLALMSVMYDFGICINPSRAFPYLVAGRLILGALIPFLLLLLQGTDFLLHGAKNNWIRPLVLAGFVLFMIVSEVVTDWTVFSSQYNWYHL